MQQEYISLPNAHVSWPKLKQDLEAIVSKKVGGVDALESLLERNDRWSNVQLPLTLLRNVLKKEKKEENFAEAQLPWLAEKALQVEELFKDYKLLNLYAGRPAEVTLTRRQICCLMSLAFFNAFDEQGQSYQQFTLCGFLSFGLYSSQKHKLLCLLNYFERIQASEEKSDEDFLSMHITVSRRNLDTKSVSWNDAGQHLLSFESRSEGLIEEAHSCLQVDFANAYIGGGVLSMGNVQEEIRFVINPECLVSILFCEEMGPAESLLITGAEQFSDYSGYGGKFTFTGSHHDANPVDDHKRRQVSIVAIDAIPFMYKSSNEQFLKINLLRELNKAYSGFSHQVSGDDEPVAGTKVSVATGNWGCGIFGGSKPLKTLLQWMAASKAGRKMVYYTFKDAELSQQQSEVVQVLLAKKVTVMELFEVLLKVIPDAGGHVDVFKNVLGAFR